jgi:hypothetical protein
VIENLKGGGQGPILAVEPWDIYVSLSFLSNSIVYIVFEDKELMQERKSQDYGDNYTKRYFVLIYTFHSRNKT